MAKKKSPSTAVIKREAKTAKAVTNALAKEVNFVSKVKARTEQQLKNAKIAIATEHSPARTLTVDLAAAGLAHGTSEGIGYLARLVGEYSLRTAGSDGHFAKHVGLYSSAPQTVIGGIIYVIELSTRDPKALKRTMGREIASATSNLMMNLGFANTLRALRYWLSTSIDEESEAQAEKNALMNKIAELQKQLDAKK